MRSRPSAPSKPALARTRLDGQPPCEATYSNFGFGILGVVLELAWDKPWAALVQEKIAGPLGLVDTVQELSAAQQARFAQPWEGAKPVHPWTFQAIAGAGALRSTLADLSKLADAFVAGPKGPLAAVWPLLSGDRAPMPSVGGAVGLALLHLKDHGEDAYGQPFLPVFATAKDELYKAVDAQLSFHRNAAGEVTGLTLHQNGRDLPAAKSGPPPHLEFPNAAALADYAGDYDFGQFQPGATITARPTGEVLLVRLTGQPAFPVFAVAKDRFEYDVVVAELTFERDAAGKVVAVVLHQNGLDMRAPKK